MKQFGQKLQMQVLHRKLSYTFSFYDTNVTKSCVMFINTVNNNNSVVWKYLHDTLCIMREWSEKMKYYHYKK